MGNQHSDEDDDEFNQNNVVNKSKNMVNKSKNMGNKRESWKYSKKKVSFGEMDTDRLGDSARRLFVQALQVGSTNEEDHGKKKNPGEKLIKEMQEFQKINGNDICADCNEPSSDWVDMTFGVFLCLDCVGAHRSLGTHISFCQSITIDSKVWTQKSIDDFIEKGGNNTVNRVMEYHVPREFPKPIKETPGKLRRKYVRAKYLDRLFCKESYGEYIKPLSPRMWRRNSTLERAFSSAHQGKVRNVGILDITVISAKGLLLRGWKDTDPYVLLQLGNQIAKTRYEKQTITPHWNEGPNQNLRLRMNWNGHEKLRVSVWHHDKFGKDVLIGKAIVELDKLLDANVNKSVKNWINLYSKSFSQPCTCGYLEHLQQTKSITNLQIRKRASKVLLLPRRNSLTRCPNCSKVVLVYAGRILLQFKFMDLTHVR